MSDVTVNELSGMCQKLFELREIVDDIKEQLREAQENYDSCETELLEMLEALGLKSFKSPLGSIETRRRESVRVPQGPAKDEFFNYLREKGQFDALITVNSQTLNSWYKQESEQAIKEQRMLVVPGLGAPTFSMSLVLKRNK